MVNLFQRIVVAAMMGLCLAWPRAGDGAVWRVSKDGSGDFTQIQDGIDAAASGDTVSIGPGTWQDTHDVVLPGGTVSLVGYVEQTDLTILGAGSTETILSVPNGPGTSGSPRGLLTGGDTDFRVEGIRFENFRNGITANGRSLVVERCNFRYNYRGLDSWAPDSTRVRESIFFDNRDRGVIVFRSLGAKDVVIEDCVFEDGAEIDLQSQSSVVRRCTFTNSTVGVQTSLGGAARVENCHFTNILSWGVGLVDASTMELQECVFELGRGGDVNVSNGSHLIGSGNVLGGASLQTLRIILSATLDFHGNQILNGGGVTVNLGGGVPPATQKAPKVFDLSGNYWGTDDPTQIEEWIYDGNDNPAIDGVVQYEPFSAVPLTSSPQTMGGLKSRFLGRN